MNKHKTHDYIEQCPYCHKFLTSLQAENHQCKQLFEIKEISISYGFENVEENGDRTFIAHGLDGKLYRLIQRKIFRTDDYLQRKRTDEDLTEPFFLL
jgi:hypothetical protein